MTLLQCKNVGRPYLGHYYFHVKCLDFFKRSWALCFHWQNLAPIETVHDTKWLTHDKPPYELVR
jgi:hypothetical protein